MSISDVSDWGPWLRKRVRLIAFLCASMALLLCSPVVVFDFVVYWQARNLIRVMKTIQVGRTTGQDAVRMTKRFGATAQITEETITKNSSTMSGHDVPLSTCMAGDCELVFRVGFSRLKFVVYLWRHPGFRRRVPWTGMIGSLEIKKGVVQDLRVELASVDEETQHSASTEIYGEDSDVRPWNKTPWRIRKTRGVITGGPGRRTSKISVEAWSSAPQDRILRAFDFNLSCLWLGVHCSRCQIMPGACEEYDHGDWYDFVMPDEALSKFRQAVNNLKLGTQRNAISHQLDDVGADTGRRLRDLSRDRLPFDFPWEAVLLGPSCCPITLTYYVKKRRLDIGTPEGPDDHSVTFVLDKDLRLLRIESRVEGILSRP